MQKTAQTLYTMEVRNKVIYCSGTSHTHIRFRQCVSGSRHHGGTAREIIEIDCYLASRTVFNIIARNSATLEKRLQIDVHALREIHARGELRDLAWIPGAQNVSDGN